jgi:hypothetical protein
MGYTSFNARRVPPVALNEATEECVVLSFGDEINYPRRFFLGNNTKISKFILSTKKRKHLKHFEERFRQCAMRYTRKFKHVAGHPARDGWRAPSQPRVCERYAYAIRFSDSSYRTALPMSGTPLPPLKKKAALHS